MQAFQKCTHPKPTGTADMAWKMDRQDRPLGLSAANSIPGNDKSTNGDSAFKVPITYWSEVEWKIPL